MTHNHGDEQRDWESHLDQVDKKLLAAAQDGNAAFVRELVALRGAPVDSIDEHACTALHYAAANGDDQVVQALVELKANVDAGSSYGWTPLMQAAAHGHFGAVNLLLNAGATVNVTNRLGATALHCAAAGGHTSVVHVLLTAGAAVLQPECPQTPLMTATLHGHEGVVRLLLDKEPRLAGISDPKTGWTPLMLASLANRPSLVQLLLQSNGQPEAKNLAQQTAYDIAKFGAREDDVCVSTGHRQDACKDASQKSGRSWKPLATKPQTVVHLLEPYADDSKGAKARRNSERYGDIFQASQDGNADVVQYLLEHEHADADTCDQDGATCLMYAAMRGHTDVVRLLVQHGAQIDAQDFISGWTALMQATYYGHRQIASMLIDAGANVGIQAFNKCTAFDIASLIGDTEVVRLLAACSMRSAPAARLSLTGEIAPSSIQTGDATIMPQSRMTTVESSRSMTITKSQTWWQRLFSHLRGLKLRRTSTSQRQDASSPYSHTLDVSVTPVVRLHSGSQTSSARPSVSDVSSATSGVSSSAVPWRRRRLNLGPPRPPSGKSSSTYTSASSGPSNVGQPPPGALNPIKPPFLPPPTFGSGASSPVAQQMAPRMPMPLSRDTELRPPLSPMSAWSPAASPSRTSHRQASQVFFGQVSPAAVIRNDRQEDAMPQRPRLGSRSFRRVGPMSQSAETSQRQVSSDQQDTISQSSTDSLRDDLGHHLRRAHLGHLTELFKEQEVDMETFLTLSNDDLIEIGISDPEDIKKTLSLIDGMKARQVERQAAVSSHSSYA